MYSSMNASMWRLNRVLPATTTAYHWPMAWIGLDVLMATGCAATALLSVRQDPRARLTASATAAVCVLDAWFDITTSGHGAALVESLLTAVGELSLASYCLLLIRPSRR